MNYISFIQSIFLISIHGMIEEVMESSDTVLGDDTEKASDVISMTLFITCIHKF